MSTRRRLLALLLLLPLGCLAPSSKQDLSGTNNRQEQRTGTIENDADVDVKADGKATGTGDNLDQTMNDASDSQAETSGGNIDQSRRQSNQAPEAGRDGSNWFSGLVNVSSPIAIAAGGGAATMFIAFMIVFVTTVRSNRKLNFANAKLRIEEEGASQAAAAYYFEWAMTIMLVQTLMASGKVITLADASSLVDAVRPKKPTPPPPPQPQFTKRRDVLAWLKVWRWFTNSGRGSGQ